LKVLALRNGVAVGQDLGVAAAQPGDDRALGARQIEVAQAAPQAAHVFPARCGV